jgi:hypothetical protein
MAARKTKERAIEIPRPWGTGRAKPARIRSELSELRSDAQGEAFLENRRSPGDRSLTVAALIGVAVTSIGALTVEGGVS